MADVCSLSGISEEKIKVASNGKTNWKSKSAVVVQGIHFPPVSTLLLTPKKDGIR